MSTENKDPIIEINDLSVGNPRFSQKTMLEAVNWKVNAGDFWVVGGLQSSGKTDLLHTLALLQKPEKGTYFLFGKETSQLDPGDLLEQRMKIGMVFDNGGRMFSHLNVKENVALPLRYHQNLLVAQAERTVKRLLEVTGLLHYSSNTIGALNRSWQQRVGLARALILKPEILLIDKPLLGLDPIHSNWWMQFLNSLSEGHAWMDKKPLTLIISDNDFRRWKGTSRQFAMIKDKKFLILAKEEQWEEEDVGLLSPAAYED